MLHGRAAEANAVEALLDGCRHSRGGALVLCGEPGIGKSSVLRHAVEQASELALLTGSAAQGEAHLPFAFLHQLLRPVLGSLNELPALQAEALGAALGLTAVASPDRFLIAVALLSLFSELSTKRPLLCLVDDAQWLDAESLDALAFVGHRASTERVALLFATTAGSGRLSDLPTLVLTGLDRVSSDALVVERSGTAPPPEVRAVLWDRTGGNPLALVETVAALRPGQLAGHEPIDPEHLPSTALQQAFVSRMSALPPSTRAVLLLAAAEGTNDLGPVLRAAALLGLDVGAFEPAEAEGSVVLGAGTITFCHPLMRTAVYQDAPFGRRQAAHRALAESLTAESDIDRAIWHRSAAAVGPDDALAEALEQAASRASRRGGHAAAAGALARASDLSSDVTVAGARMMRAAEASWSAGRPLQARALSNRALELDTTSAVRVPAEHLHGLVEANLGDRRVALSTLLAAAGRGHDDPTRTARILLDAGHLAWSDADLAGMCEIADRLTTLELETGDPTAFAAGVMIGLGHLARGDVATGASLLRASLAPANRDDPRQLHLAGTAAMFAGDDRTAFELLQSAAARARALGEVTSLPQTLANLAALELWRGNFSTARTYAAEGADLGRAVGQGHWVAQCSALLAWMAAVQGRHPDLDQLATEAIELAAPRHARSPVALARWARAMSAIGASRWPDAMATLDAIANEQASDFHPPTAFLSGADLVEAAWRIERVDLARSTLDRFEAFVARTGAAWAKALAARCQAILSAGDDAAEWFERALAHHADSGRRFDEARTHLLYGEHLRRARQRSAARIHLRAATDWFERLQAVPWTERARSELRATGETARKRDPGALTSLTPQQLQIVGLVADGATNKEIAGQLFLSPRTVDYHLRNVFVSLGITSRAELIKLTATQG